MNYQPKTTVINMSVGLRTEETKCSLGSRLSALHAVAIQIAVRCQMDIMSIAPHSIGEECAATVVYVNNGCSVKDILRIMKTEIDNETPKYWMILDMYEWQGLLDCIISTKGTDDTQD